MSKLEVAIEFAFKAHKGQVDKAGFPYILHPLAVMGRVFKPLRGNYTQAIAAVLHDVVEDCHVTLGVIEGIFGPEVMSIVDSLTRRKDEETYAAYIERLAQNPDAVEVKFADLEENLRSDRSLVTSPEIASLRSRYRRAKNYLKSIKIADRLGGSRSRPDELTQQAEYREKMRNAEVEAVQRLGAQGLKFGVIAKRTGLSIDQVRFILAGKTKSP